MTVNNIKKIIEYGELMYLQNKILKSKLKRLIDS